MPDYLLEGLVLAKYIKVVIAWIAIRWISLCREYKEYRRLNHPIDTPASVLNCCCNLTPSAFFYGIKQKGANVLEVIASESAF